MEAIRDPYAVERISELLLRQLATEHVSDVEAYWIIWLLFHRMFDHQTSIRSVDLQFISFDHVKTLIFLAASSFFFHQHYSDFNKLTMDNLFLVKVNGKQP